MEQPKNIQTAAELEAEAKRKRKELKEYRKNHKKPFYLQ